MHSNYDNYRGKDALRDALVVEQRGLCCYCMKRIRPSANDMKIEHWQCQAHYRAKQLNYRNLLGACLGGKEELDDFQHCDTKKADSALRWNPADPTHAIESRVQYDLDGTIRSNDDVFNTQLNEILNLNLSFLKNNRKALLDSLLNWWKKQPRPVSRRRIERKRREYDPGNGELTPYCQIAIWWLDRKLARMAQPR